MWCNPEDFRTTSGLRVNWRKTSAMPNRCSKDHAGVIAYTLGCVIGSFPCKYLGRPFGIHKLPGMQLQPLVDQLANKLPTWREALLPKSGRLLLVQMMICAILIHAMMALDLPPTTIAAMNKIRGGFLWCAKSEASRSKWWPGRRCARQDGWEAWGY